VLGFWLGAVGAGLSPPRFIGTGLSGCSAWQHLPALVLCLLDIAIACA
jgi:hypothetical protein